MASKIKILAAKIESCPDCIIGTTYKIKTNIGIFIQCKNCSMTTQHDIYEEDNKVKVYSNEALRWIRKRFSNAVVIFRSLG